MIRVASEKFSWSYVSKSIGPTEIFLFVCSLALLVSVLFSSGLLSGVLFKDSEVGNREYAKVVSWVNRHNMKSEVIEMVSNDGMISYEEYRALSNLVSIVDEFKTDDYKRVLKESIR